MWPALRRAVRRVLRLAVAAPALIGLVLVALAERPASAARRRAGTRPRLGYGPVPILSFKYMSRAMRTIGYEATTVVHELYDIHAAGDFDIVTRSGSGTERPRRGGRVPSWLWSDVRTFAWALRRFDVFHCFFDGGFLRTTALRRLEVQLLHLAGKRLIVMPYGSDTAVPSRIRSMAWREGLMRNYPQLGRTERETLAWIDYYSQHADYVVGCLVHSETMPRWDLLTTHYYPIDTDAWAPVAGSSCNGQDGPVVVVHAPNHRGMKGTEFLLEAVRTLQAEGLDVQLRLLERVPNAEVKAAMEAADIVADQFLLGYALTAMEGMSLGKPVLSNLSDPAYYDIHRWTTGLDVCPIVSTTPDRLVDDLRGLVVDPLRRAKLGRDGRAYVVAYHGYQAMARLWDTVYRRVWSGEALDPRDALPHGRPGG